MLSQNFALVACVTGQVSPERLRGALSRIHLAHPALAPSGAATVFPLTVWSDCRADAWLDRVTAELGEPFSGASCARARFHLLQRPTGFDLVGCFDHAACEGMSGTFVFRDIFRLLDDPAIAMVAVPPATGVDRLFPPEVLNSVRFRLKLRLGMALLRGYLQVQKVRRRGAPHTARDPARTAPSDAACPSARQFILLPTLLTQEQTSVLAARCKAEQVSVHAAICVAWLRALQGDMKRGQARRGMVSSPVDLRRRLSAPVPETAGLFLTLVETSIECGIDREFWQLAREFKRTLDAQLQPRRLLLRPVMFTKILSTFSSGDLDLLVRTIFGAPAKHDFSVTNLGRVPIPPRIGSMQVQAFYAVVNSSPSERTVAVTTLGGRMGVVLAFRRSLMDGDTGRRLMDRAMQVLMDAAQAP